MDISGETELSAYEVEQKIHRFYERLGKRVSYLQWEFMSDRKDPRIDKVFSDICIPNNINQGDLDVDFSNYSVEEFLKEIMKLKN